MSENKTNGKGRLSPVFLWLAVLFNVCLIASNLFAIKIFQIWDWCVLPGAVIIFPVSYILNDCISEVYGYRKARFVIWTGFAMNLFFVLAAQLVLALPGAPFWGGQEAFSYVFGAAPKTLAASLLAFLAGSNVNAMTMSWMKVKDNGRRFGVRAIISSIAGELVDSLIFIPIVFWSQGLKTVLIMAACQVTAKVLYEIVILPLTAVFVRRLKEYEGEDAFDEGISYNPFKFKID
ncbi:MAG: queuosine precursor transporter [Bacteroidales bacterium]|nr:queuosine precursor transporter [Bacteroidales bacterium]